MAALVRGFSNVFVICNRTVRSTVPRVATVALQKKALYHNMMLKGTMSYLITQKKLPRISEQIRQFAEGNVSVDQIQERVIKVLSQFGKISGDKLKLDSHFMNDLGLDSLDHVEIIMAMEDEFGFEIPDVDAEKLLKPADIVRYVADREDVYA